MNTSGSEKREAESAEAAICGIPLSLYSREEVFAKIAEWGHSGRAAYVCFVTDHMIALAREDH